MRGSICSDIFAIRTVITLACTLSINAMGITRNDKSLTSVELDRKYIELVGQTTHTVIIPFNYTIGTGFDTGHANYGFSLEKLKVPDGIIIMEDFSGDPDTTGQPNESKSAEVTLSIVIPETALNDASFSVRIVLNTGK